MKKSSTDDYINVSLFVMYFLIMIAMILCFEWVRKIRKDSRKEIAKDAFQKMADSIGLSCIKDE
jgi:hypothetical protein